MHYQQKEKVKRMSEKLYGVDNFYTGDFAQILTGIYKRRMQRNIRRCCLHIHSPIDLETRQYIAFGSSMKSESEAYDRAMKRPSSIGA
jgi:transposase